MQDIDYAAEAVKTAILEKFGNVADLEIVANDRTIAVIHASRRAEGTRDNLLAAVRKTDSYDDFWQLLNSSGAQLSSSGPTN